MKSELPEELIQKILDSQPSLTRKEVIEMIDRRTEKAKGFLARESAARVVALELGVKLSDFTFKRRVSISDLVSGLGDVTVVGRVIFVSSVRTFTRSDGGEGRVRRMFIADKTGELKVLLWDDQADVLAAGSLVGKLIRFSHGYVRAGFYGRLELNMGSRGMVEVAPSDAKEEKFPLLENYAKRIADIKEEGRISTFGIISQIYPVSTFNREDGSEGKVRWLELEDDSGRITAVLWNRKVEGLADVQVGCCLQLHQAKVRQSMNGGVELHVDSSVGVAVLEEAPLGYGHLRNSKKG